MKTMRENIAADVKTFELGIQMEQFVSLFHPLKLTKAENYDSFDNIVSTLFIQTD